MTYQSKHTQIKSPKEWYNFVAEEYWKYHTLINSFDQWLSKRFFPRGKNNLDIIDLWAWDGRLFPTLKNLNPQRYVACDIAEKLLKRHPWTNNIEKIICDLEENLPFEDNSFDLATSFFVLEHINNIDHLFSEVYRILKPGGRRIIGHFIQRREFTWKKNNQEFKIQFYNHRIQDLEAIADNNFFSKDIFPIEEKGYTIGHILILSK